MDKLNADYIRYLVNKFTRVTREETILATIDHLTMDVTQAVAAERRGSTQPEVARLVKKLRELDETIEEAYQLKRKAK